MNLSHEFHQGETLLIKVCFHFRGAKIELKYWKYSLLHSKFYKLKTQKACMDILHGYNATSIKLN